MISLVLILISAIFGAGFATGAELVAFFGASTLPPAVTATIVGIIMFAFMAILVFTSRYKLPNWIVRIVSLVFLIAMVAGTTGLSSPIIALASIVGCIMIIKLGFDSALKINKYVMTFALTVIFLVSFLHLGEIHVTHGTSNITWTIWRALLYAGMNCFLLIAVFALARNKYSTQQLLIASVIASAVIAFFAFVIINAVYVGGASHAVIPILHLNNSFLVWLSIFICIFTSMYIAMLGVTQNQENTRQLLLIGAIAFLLSFLGFKKIIATFYPLIGVAMILYVTFISFLTLRSAFQHNHGRQCRR